MNECAYQATARLLKLRLTPEQHAASRYLERQGLRFCVHFGTDNCVELARQRWNAHRRELRKRRLS